MKQWLKHNSQKIIQSALTIFLPSAFYLTLSDVRALTAWSLVVISLTVWGDRLIQWADKHGKNGPKKRAF